MHWWTVLPFLLLLITIAVTPIIVPRLWHRLHPVISLAFAVLMIVVFVDMHRVDYLVQAGVEYVGFMALLGSLFLAGGGIVLDVRCRATPTANTALLLGGAMLANLIGTTGASLLLIRPFIRLNAGRLQPYHVVFFIFMVANIGGALTPIGDPPLFLGYLRGIPFFRFLTLNLAAWTLALGCLAAIFWWCDTRNRVPASHDGRRRLSLEGAGGLVALVVIISAVFLDPGKLLWLPAIEVSMHGHSERISFVRELVQLTAGLVAWRTASPHLHRLNNFSFGPIREIAFLFLGIFATMVPALALIHSHAATGSWGGLPLDATFFYFGTGALSSVLDNAPTFLAFLASLEGKTGMDTATLAISHDAAIASDLAACTMAAVFWGAMTYIGNGPNFMIKAICEDARDADGKPLVEVPGFFAYIFRYALPILLPVLILVWAVLLR